MLRALKPRAGPTTLRINGLAFSPRGDVLAAASFDGAVWLWGLAP
jgi:hypothetical protein